MADTKITALTALTAADPSTDVLPIVDTSDTTMAASGTTKKISINNILGASGTATLASATITGDLTVDTNTLKVDSSLDFVAIGATAQSFGEKFRINGNYTVMNDGAFTGFLGKASAIGASGSTTDFGIRSENALVFLTNGATEQMRLNATGLGVGGSPNISASGKALTISGAFTRSRLELQNTDGGTGGVTCGTISWFNGSNLIADITGAANSGSATLGSLAFSTGGSTRLTIDSSGNVGIGVTPSAWGSNYKSIDLVGGGRVFTVSGTGTHGFSFNAFNNNTNWLYQFSTVASRFELQQSGNFAWLTAPSGTAGNAITFTQAMTLDASGNLLVGTTSAGGNRLNVQTASGDCTTLIKSQAANVNSAIDYVSNYGNHTIRKSGTAVWDFGVINDSSATPAFKVSNASSVGVQLVSGATSWTTLSDETMKDIIEPISNAVSKVGSLRSVIGKFKTDDSSKRRSFLIAQDVQSVLPEAVDVIGENNELGLRYTEVIPLLVAAIKELTARVQTLEAK